MAGEGHIQIVVEESRIPHQTETTPFLKNQGLESNPARDGDPPKNSYETLLDKTLQRLDLYLSFLGFSQSSLGKLLLSWGTFLVIGVLVPVVILELSNCPGCEKGQIKSFEIVMVVSQACLATTSLMCLSHNLGKYGVMKFLFVDRYSGHVDKFNSQYIRKISECRRMIVLWVLPCCLLKTVREIIRIMNVHHESWWQSLAILFAFVFSWTYVTTIILSASVVFHLVCNLQIFHLEDYGNLLEKESDVMRLLQEHIRLRCYLSKISHRFRLYLILQFVIVTISQFVILSQISDYNGLVTVINGGDFAVASVVQVVGIILCLNAAAKISHRAQGIGAMASRWHALVMCSASEGSLSRTSSSTGNLETMIRPASFNMDYSESDMESMDYYMTVPTNCQLVSYMSSYHKRLALGESRGDHDIWVDN